MLLPDCVDGPAHENRKHFHAIPPGGLDAIAALRRMGKREAAEKLAQLKA